jgi:hypothetical protein
VGPYVFPTAGLLSGLPLPSTVAIHGRVGKFCYYTMTLVGPGTWQSARAAADAADLVSAGAPAEYALYRPPGHHAGPAANGGSCYLNNAAIAAQALRRSGAARVAVIDVDAHHGDPAHPRHRHGPVPFDGDLAHQAALGPNGVASAARMPSVPATHLMAAPTPRSSSGATSGFSRRSQTADHRTVLIRQSRYIGSG